MFPWTSLWCFFVVCLFFLFGGRGVFVVVVFLVLSWLIFRSWIKLSIFLVDRARFHTVPVLRHFCIKIQVQNIRSGQIRLGILACQSAKKSYSGAVIIQFLQLFIHQSYQVSSTKIISPNRRSKTKEITGKVYLQKISTYILIPIVCNNLFPISYAPTTKVLTTVEA